MEEAALIASEYISTLDNLPLEVQHLLAEIRIKEDRAVEINNDIQSKTQKYIRHYIRQAGTSKEVAPDIDQLYAEVDRLSLQKIELATRITALINRVIGRLDVELVKALAVAGDPPPDLNAVGGPAAYAAGNWPAARAITDRLKDTLRAELSLTLSDAPSPSPSAQGGPLKKRRLNPPTVPSTPTPSGPSAIRANRASAAARSSRRSQSIMDDDLDADQDADGEPDDNDAKDVADTDDQSLYCYCRKMSYGEMVGCDNGDCPYQWFHLSCTGIKGPLPESWYCSDCAPKFQFGGPSEKSRKGRRPRV